MNVSSPNAKLVISYIGYVSQEVLAPKNGELKVVLKEDTETLEEVVVVGYGTQKKQTFPALYLLLTVNSSKTDRYKT